MTLGELPDIYFIRHGQTAWNAEGRYQGQKDIPLNQVGQGQADGNGFLLRDLLARDGLNAQSVDWFASPLSRTRETMERVRSAFEGDMPPISLDPRLVEISFGVYEGMLASSDGPMGMKFPGERDESFWHFTPDKGENYDMVADRVRMFLKELQKPAVVVAHGGVARVFRYLVEGASRTEAVNWPTPQDVILHFSRGQLAVIPAAHADID